MQPTYSPEAEAYREKARALFALMEKRPAPAENKK